jgi:hypothetical protein
MVVPPLRQVMVGVLVVVLALTLFIYRRVSTLE